MINIDDKYIRVMEHFGETEQFNKLLEEFDELKVAILDLCNERGSVEEVEKELADLNNVAMQYIVKYGGSGEAVLSHCPSKMIRTEKRIASGFYEKN